MAEEIDKMLIHGLHLRYEAELRPFAETIETYYSSKSVHVYRTVVNKPARDIDFTPQLYQNRQGMGTQLPAILSEETVASLSENERKEYVSARAISVHLTEEKSKQEAIRQYRSIKKKHSVHEAEEYAERKRGKYIVKLTLSPSNALVSAFHRSTSHANVLLKEGVVFEELIDKEFGYKEFSYHEDDDK